MTPCVEWIPFAVVVLVMKEMMTTQQTLLIAVAINVDNIETEGTGTVSSVVRACDCDIDVSHQNRTNDLDLAKFLKQLLNYTAEK